MIRRCGVFVALLTLALGLPGGAEAFHAPPWDTGHQSFQPDNGDPNNTPGPSKPDGCGSPVEVATGNLVYQRNLINVRGLGPALVFSAAYNSQDLRAGPLGKGWRHPYDVRLVLATDGVQVVAICQQGTGYRDRFTRLPDGTYTSPPSVHSRLVRNGDGSHSLREKTGTTRHFDPDGRLIAIVDRNGNAETLAYDGVGFLTTVTDASGRSLQLVKGPNGSIHSLQDPAGRQTGFEYDANNNLVAIVDTGGDRWPFQYGPTGQLSAVRDPNGNPLLTATYDASRRVATYSDGPIAYTLTYSPTLKRTTERETVGGATYTFIYNDSGSILSRTDPLGFTESKTYDANLNVLSYTDKNGNTTTYQYDALGNPTRITDAGGQATVLAYEPNFSSPISVTDPVGNTTTLSYDLRGNLLTTTDASGAVTSRVYDSRGQLIRVTDAVGNVAAVEYDQYGNVISRIDPAKSTITSTFDILGRNISFRDAGGRLAQWVYDVKGRLSRHVNPAGEATAYVYDATDNLSEIAFANGARTSYVYDSFSRVTRITDAGGRNTTFTYDTRGNLGSRTNPNGQTISYTYDLGHRLTAKGLPGESISYQYDRNGNPTRIQRARSLLTYTYDFRNRPLTATTGAAAQPTTTTRYTYDANGNRSTMTEPGGAVTTYSYDANQLLTSLSSSIGFSASFSHDDISRRTLMTRTGGATTAYAYDESNRLRSLHSESPAGPLDYVFTNDLSGTRVAVADNGGTHSYSYDQANRLTQATYPGQSEVYVYDAMGNRTASHLSSAYSYNNLNQLLGDANHTYAYDSNGNLVTKTERSTGRVTRYVYDAENHLTQITFPDNTTATYTYDELGRRVEKNVNGVITRFVYDGADVIAEYNGSNALTARYVYGPNVDEVLAVQRSSSLFVVDADAQGSVVRLVAGSNVVSREYDSFGRVVSQSPNFALTAKAFQGRDFDVESGLYYYRARYYDPDSGRFVSQDPIGYRGGANLYAFAGSNPVNHRDPHGLWLDTFIDLGFIAYDIYQLFTDSCNVGENLTALGLDVVGAVVPFATGLGQASRVARHADDVADVAQELHRPYIRKSTREAVENAAQKTADGKFIDPNTGKVIDGKYDLGHKPGNEHWREKAKAEAEGLTQKQFNDRMNDPSKYQIEDPSSNRSHRYEQKK